MPVELLTICPPLGSRTLLAVFNGPVTVGIQIQNLLIKTFDTNTFGSSPSCFIIAFTVALDRPSFRSLKYFP